MSAIITRIEVGDDAWRSMFDQDRPRAREKATVERVLRSVEDPNEVFYLPRVRLTSRRAGSASGDSSTRASSIASTTSTARTSSKNPDLPKRNTPRARPGTALRSTHRPGQKEFTEPVAFWSTTPTNFRLPPTALANGFDLLTLRARCKKES